MNKNTADVKMQLRLRLLNAVGNYSVFIVISLSEPLQIFYSKVLIVIGPSVVHCTPCKFVLNLVGNNGVILATKNLPGPLIFCPFMPKFINQFLKTITASAPEKL